MNIGKTRSRSKLPVLAWGLALLLMPHVWGQGLPPKAADELRRALQHFEQGDYPKALGILLPLEQAYPGSFDVAHLLAVTLDLAGKPEEAHRRFQKAVDLNPQSAGAHANLGTSLVRIGKTDAAVAQFRQALKINPNNATANFNLGTILLRQRKIRDALPYLQKAYTLQPGVYENAYHLALCYFVSGDYSRAQRVLDSLQPIPKERAEFHLILALNQKASGKSQEAQETLQGVLPLLAAQPESHEQVSMLLFSQGMFREAVPVLDAAVRRFPKSETALANLAQAELQIGELENALEHAQRALALKETAQGHILLADIFERSHQPLAAIEHYQLAVRMDPSESNLVALGYEFLAHWNWKEAQEVYAFALTKFGNSWRLRLGLGAAYLGQDDFEKATQCFLGAIPLAPDEPLCYQLLAESFEQSSESFDKAIARFHAYYQSHPDSPQAVYYHVLADHRSSTRHGSPPDYDGSIVLLRKAIDRNPDFYAAHFLLGELFFAHQNWQEAIAAYEQTVRRNPEHLEAHYRLGLSLQRVGQTERAKAELKLFQDLKEKQSQAVAQRIARTASFLVNPGK